jgi:metal-responsive CopG/Arc/MetJ family transcriptional regulator
MYELTGIDNSILFSYTNSMKTAISVPDDLFEEIEKYAQERGSSRSEVFVLAVRDFLRKKESADMLEALNSVYSESDNPEEAQVKQKSRKYHSRRAAREKY